MTSVQEVGAESPWPTADAKGVFNKLSVLSYGKEQKVMLSLDPTVEGEQDKLKENTTHLFLK
jgi:hypothetical protein